MANLSNVNPLTGVGEGFTQGIRNAGAVVGMQQQQEAARRESEMFPLRKAAMEREGKMQEFQLKKAQDDQIALEAPWDVTKHPAFASAELEQRAQIEEMAKRYPKNGRGRLMFLQDMQTDSVMYDSVTKMAQNHLRKQVGEAEKTYRGLLGKDNPDMTALANAKLDYDQKWQAFSNGKGKIEEGRISTSIMEMIKTKPDLFATDSMKLAAIYAQQTGDPDLLKKLLEEGMKAKTTKNYDKFDVFWTGKIQDSIATGKPLDREAALAEYNEIEKRKPLQEGEIRKFEGKGDKHITEEVTKNKDGKLVWTRKDSANMFNPKAGETESTKESAQQRQFRELRDQNPTFNKLPQALFVQANKNMALGEPPFKKGTYWANEWDKLMRSQPNSATGMPEARVSGKSYQGYLNR